jgi:two-component system, chemotaxis family, chemotaxis protein CheY
MNNLKLLIVDDDKATQKLVRRVAESIGFEHIRKAENGNKALDMIAKERPDLILLDWEMPEKNGVEVLKELHEQKKLRDISIMMLTANKEREGIEEAVKLGIADYIVKPIKIPMLKERLEKLMQTHNNRLINSIMDQY